MTKWNRVNKKRKCAICERPDWCTYTDDAACCMRVKSEKELRNGGWLHVTGTTPRYIRPVRQAIPDRPIDAESMWQQWFQSTERGALDAFGLMLGVDTDALRTIGTAWASPNKAWAFPMKQANGKVIGIRLRDDAGNKWAVKGSKAGLFIPEEYPVEFDGTLWLTEGPTDLAAALTIGLFAVGRPACLGQEEMILAYLDRIKTRRLVIVTDNDEPGIRGAEKLQSRLPILSCIWIPPVKDMREYVNRGGSKRMIEGNVNDLVWTRASRRAA